jgi:hypothetical protein
LGQAEADLGDAKNSATLAAVVEPLAVYAGAATRGERARRGWTWLDGPVPEGALAGYAMGEIGPVEAEPPWLAAGEMRWVEVDELWELLEPALSRDAKESALREQIWSAVLRARLADGGHLESHAAAWAAFASEHAAGRKALLGLDAQALMIHGYPSLAHYRDATRLLRSFAAAQPAGWDEGPRLRAFFERNRFFLQRWRLELDIAVFPENSRAEVFAAEIRAGADFRERAGEYGRDPGLRGGRDAAELRDLLGESRWTELLDGASAAENAIVRLRAGQVSPVWRTRAGYAVFRAGPAEAAAPAAPFEELEDAARERLRATAFRRWANAELSRAALER